MYRNKLRLKKNHLNLMESVTLKKELVGGYGISDALKRISYIYWRRLRLKKNQLEFMEAMTH